MAWPAGVGLIVAGAYLANRPGLFGKRADGTLSPLPVLLLLTHYAFTWAVWQLQRTLGGEDASNEVAPGLWVGRRPCRHELPVGTALVVDLTAEFPVHAGIRAEVPWVCLPTLDGTAPPLAGIPGLLERIDAAQGPVYIHCAAGHGRSATVAAAVLLRRGLVGSIDEAEALMQGARPRVHINSAQRRALEALGAP